MLWLWMIFGCVWVTTLSESSHSPPLVSVAQGTLQGSWMKSRDSKEFAAFKSIPYAKPPVGKLRFQSPIPASGWNGTRDATSDGASCVQINSLDSISSNEDCLILNVFTPNISENADMAVIVYIHGGAFKTGSSNSLFFGPEYLLDHPIVLVTINYRLGVLAFLSLEDSVLPGNLGLKDQREALRWVKRNIHKFGGNPQKVTLFGESAGSQSVHYHMMFTSHEGLFRAGICHSGTAMAVGFQRPGDQKSIRNFILNQTDCNAESSLKIVQCLRNIDAHNLTTVASLFTPPTESLLWQVDLTAVQEPDCVEDAFITGAPWKQTFSTPLLIGTNKYESLPFVVLDLLNDTTNTYFDRFNQNFREILPHNLMFMSSAENPAQVAELLRSFYFKDQQINRDSVFQLIDMLSDGMFNFGTKETIMRNLNTTYLFSYNYKTTLSLINVLGYNISIGPSHSEELLNFFSLLLIQAEKFLSANDIKLSKQLVRIWTNYAIYLDPNVGEETVEWKPVSSPALEYLSIDGPDNLTMTSHFYPQRMEFWQNLPFRNKPLPDSIKCSDYQTDNQLLSYLKDLLKWIVSGAGTLMRGVLGQA